ncbi:hypothetical protein HK097_000352 [Rhizophlyctis rosea]|uniref:SGNH hydrolase-type esterase domain-containing protein n=1 Tax=Rhizophlyctis rosea TaxID=64517 RepID=A0AAD5S5Q7_9FUNG|nr:hypothetical protein HK097_000352 [Rhizophlyctis rosea]
MPNATFNVLGLGDSLTQGFTSGGHSFHPYTTTLKGLISKHTTVNVINKGVSGDKVTGPQMLPRLQEAIHDAANNNYRFDWIIIMAGINDLYANRNLTPPQLYAGLTIMLQLPSQSANKVLIMNLMEIGPDKTDDVLRNRILEYNKLIEEGCGAWHNVCFLDMRRKLRMHSVPDRKRKELWDDVVHLTAKGYKKMGKIIYEKIRDVEEWDEKEASTCGGCLQM